RGPRPPPTYGARAGPSRRRPRDDGAGVRRGHAPATRSRVDALPAVQATEPSSAGIDVGSAFAGSSGCTPCALDAPRGPGSDHLPRLRVVGAWVARSTLNSRNETMSRDGVGPDRMCGGPRALDP